LDLTYRASADDPQGGKVAIPMRNTAIKQACRILHRSEDGVWRVIACHSLLVPDHASNRSAVSIERFGEERDKEET
jgi:hypothetical protein